MEKPKNDVVDPGRDFKLTQSELAEIRGGLESRSASIRRALAKEEHQGIAGYMREQLSKIALLAQRLQ